MNNIVKANLTSPIPTSTKLKTGFRFALGVAAIALASFVVVSNVSKSNPNLPAAQPRIEVSAIRAQPEVRGLTFYLVATSEQALQAETSITRTLMEQYLVATSGLSASANPVRNVIVKADASPAGLQAEREMLVSAGELILAGGANLAVIDLRKY
jgi:hypothetical protein